MANNVYLPPKGSKWNWTVSLSDPKDNTKYSKPFGDMDVLNEKEINKEADPTEEELFAYHHKDGSDRHPETLYLVPGNPRQRSDSLTR